MQKHPTSNIERPTSNETPRARTGRVFDLEERLLEFASAVIDLTEKLPSSRSGNHISGQLLRSGTSPFANHGEAESAESPDDFIHKLAVCLKELRETRRWLRLIQRKSWLPTDQQLDQAAVEVEELIRIFAASIRTARQNQINPKPVNPPANVRS